MKTLSILFGICVFALGIKAMSGDEIERSSREQTTGARMDKTVDHVAAIAEGIDFRCNPFGYKNVANSLGIDLHWDTVKARCDGALACANGNNIHMQIGMCNESSTGVFFHEIGHILLGHTGTYCGKDYANEMEIEANYFALYLLEQLKLPNSPVIDHYIANPY